MNTEMPSPIYQYVIKLVMSLHIRRGQGVFMNVWVSENIFHNNYALATVLLTKYYSDDQVEESEIGRICSMYGRREV